MVTEQERQDAINWHRQRTTEQLESATLVPLPSVEALEQMLRRGMASQSHRLRVAGYIHEALKQGRQQEAGE